MTSRDAAIARAPASAREEVAETEIARLRRLYGHLATQPFLRAMIEQEFPGGLLRFCPVLSPPSSSRRPPIIRRHLSSFSILAGTSRRRSPIAIAWPGCWVDDPGR
jgi:hypothetical protein